jgi:lipocalin-like protein
MNTSIVYGIGCARLVVGVVFAGLLSAPAIALGQSLKEQIVGPWRTVSFYNEQGGVKQYVYGEKPMGLTLFDRSGYVIGFLSIPELPKFAVNNRLKGTDAEYRAVMQNMISQFGTYTVEGDTVTIKWIASSFPNRAGTTEKRTYTIKGNEMSSVNPTSASGGTAHQGYVRAK